MLSCSLKPFPRICECAPAPVLYQDSCKAVGSSPACKPAATVPKRSNGSWLKLAGLTVACHQSCSAHVALPRRCCMHRVLAVHEEAQQDLAEEYGSQAHSAAACNMQALQRLLDWSRNKNAGPGNRASKCLSKAASCSRVMVEAASARALILCA